MPKIKKTVHRPWNQKRESFGRKKKQSDNSKFYNNRKWRKHRELFLSQFPLCRICKNKGFIVEAKVVDHIKRINDDGDKWAYSNLQPLCKRCHNSKSGKEAHL